MHLQQSHVAHSIAMSIASAPRSGLNGSPSHSIGPLLLQLQFKSCIGQMYHNASTALSEAWSSSAISDLQCPISGHVSTHIMSLCCPSCETGVCSRLLVSIKCGPCYALWTGGCADRSRSIRICFCCQPLQAENGGSTQVTNTIHRESGHCRN